jgi:hypothetical protein
MRILTVKKRFDDGDTSGLTSPSSEMIAPCHARRAAQG